MNSMTYDVRLWTTRVYKGKRKTTYTVRWIVAGEEFNEPFQQSALAESFLSELRAATRKGEAFDVISGLPISMQRNRDMAWYEFACEYVDMKWPHSAAKTRETVAEAMTTITTALFTNDRNKPDDKVIRSALTRWAFNTKKRGSNDCPREVNEALRWIEKHTRQVSELADPTVLRPVLNRLSVKLDGKPAAPSRVRRQRAILNTAVEYAMEGKMLTSNPIPALKKRAPKGIQPVDRRSVANPTQVRTLLNAIEAQRLSGPRLVAFFACLYFAALRPEEAVGLNKSNLALPEEGWGELVLDTAEPHAGKDWTDSGATRDRRQLKQREVGETRIVPCSPELTALLHKHIETFGTGSDGRIFRGERNENELPKLTINRAWQRARQDAFTPQIAATPLARTPYDLRHAAVSTWLNGGVPATTVAKWAGHSVEVLLKTYAKCLDGEDAALQQRVQAALGHGTAA